MKSISKRKGNGRATAFKASALNERTCTAKATYLQKRQRLRREQQRLAQQEVKKAMMLAARMHAPAAPATRDKLALLVGEVALAQAERTLLDAHPHLSAERDGALVASLAYLNCVLNKAWAFFDSKSRLAHATRSGRVTWNAGLKTLLLIEETRRRLASELAVTPSSKKTVGLSIETSGNVLIIGGDKEAYIAKLRALRSLPPGAPITPEALEEAVRALEPEPAAEGPEPAGDAAPTPAMNSAGRKKVGHA